MRSLICRRRRLLQEVPSCLCVKHLDVVQLQRVLACQVWLLDTITGTLCLT